MRAGPGGAGVPTVPVTASAGWLGGGLALSKAEFRCDSEARGRLEVGDGTNNEK